MKALKLFSIALIIMTLTIGCSSKKSTEPSVNLDANLVGNWILTSYVDEDGEQDYEGYFNVEANGNMNGAFTDPEEAQTYTFSGKVSTSGSTMTTEVTQTSNSLWLETGTYEWNYSINGNILTMNEISEEDPVTLTYSKENENSEDKGNLSGTVTDNSKGEPIAGVLVQILNTSFSTTTDNNGEYQITDVPVGVYSVKASKSGYESYTENNVQINKNQTTTLDFEISETGGGVGSIDGFVADVINQTVIEGAYIVIEGTSFATYSSSEGIYFFENVPAGNYNITCTKNGYESQTINAEVIADDEISVDFLLLPEGSSNYGSISGIVTNTDGEPIVNVVVQVEGYYNSSLTFEDGSYEIFAIPEGTYSLSFTKPGYEAHIEENVVVTNGGTTTVDVQLQQIAGSGNLICYVENTFELPVNGALVEVLGTSFSATTGIGGMCTIQNIPAGMYTVRVSKSGYQTQEIENVEILAGYPQTLYVTLSN